jgi:hypothetical protein
MGETPTDSGAVTPAKTAVAPMGNRLVAAVFLIGFVSLGYELLQVRMLSFFLGSISNFLAIPVALFGLALGSMYCHFIHRGDARRLVSRCLLLVFPVLAAVLIAFFAIANGLFHEVHVTFSQPGENVARLLVYSALFLPPYFLFGALLSSIFAMNAARIGRLYFFDLSGAALGCFAVPLLFTYTDLPVVILSLLASALLLALASAAPRRAVVFGVCLAAFAGIVALTVTGTVFRERPDIPILAKRMMSPKSFDRYEEVAARWNDVARTSLIRGYRIDDVDAETPEYIVVQDDGISNVYVRGYDPGLSRDSVMQRSRFAHAFPFALGIRPRNILVMFAGTGRDMVLLDALAERRARITGVELNRAVVDFAFSPVLRPLRLGEFLSRDGIRLVAREGRDFLNNSTEKFDLVFVATNGSVHATRTGHTRKYLDTYQAMGAYLDHLAPDGALFFWNQPVEHKVVSLGRLLAERKLGDPGSAMYAYGAAGSDTLRCLLVKPAGFSRSELEALRAHHRGADAKRALLYAPGGRGTPRFKAIVGGRDVPDLPREPITDNDPFTNKVELSRFSLVPDESFSHDLKYSSDWIKVFTVILLAFVSLVVIAALRFLGSRDRRLPLPWFAYFFVSGLGYMGVEIGLIGKIELFMGNPLYAVAVILAVFLLSNALGAFLQDKYRVMRGWKTLLGYTSVAVLWSVTGATICNSFFLSIPLPLKIVAVAAAVGPAGIFLGMYYPFGVSTLVGAGRTPMVPATYAIATLSSVVSSAAAMTAITIVGFSSVILLGALCYAAVAFVFVAARRFAL